MKCYFLNGARRGLFPTSRPTYFEGRLIAIDIRNRFVPSSAILHIPKLMKKS